MKTLRKITVMLIALAITGSVRASVTLLSDDMSTLDNFTSTTLTGTTGTWTSNGTDANFHLTDAAAQSTTARARLTSNLSFGFYPGGTNYQSVTLEFTTTATSFDVAGHRYEIGLVTTDTVSLWNAAAFMGTANVEGIVLTQTGDYPLGLKVRAGGTAPGATTAAAIGMSGLTGTHDYKIVFTATGTELFRDGVSLGMTASVLDFSKDYNVVAWGQSWDGRSSTLRTKSLDQVQLTAAGESKAIRLILIH